MKAVLQIAGLSKIYGPGCAGCIDEDRPYTGNVCPGCGSVVACANVDFELYDGEVLGIVGESGSGKSTVVKLLYFDEPPTAGTMNLRLDRTRLRAGSDIDWAVDGSSNLLVANAFQKRMIRNRLMGMVYQSPHLGLKMNVSAGGNIGERLLMADCRSVARIRERASELLVKTEVPVNRMDEMPSHFSGGMQQRVQIARALSINPRILFLDEPTTGLDLSVQARVLDMVKSLQKEMRLTTVVVSHDLGIIRHLTSRTIVMKDGRVVETGLTDQILEDPQHAFTQLLVNSAL